MVIDPQKMSAAERHNYIFGIQENYYVVTRFGWFESLLSDIRTLIEGGQHLKNTPSIELGGHFGAGNVSIPILICIGLELASALYIGKTNVKDKSKYQADENDRRLEVYDPQYYPTSKMIEDSCRTIIEYPYKDGGISNRKYRLVDHEGNDITPTVLVDEYLSNPEICFKEPPLVSRDIPRQFSNKDVEDSSASTATITPHDTKIVNTGIRVGGQLLLFRNQIDFFLYKIHPGIQDNSIKVEFVTSKTQTNPNVRFLNRQTVEHGYYYSCYHCYDISKATFGSIDEYERHIVNSHKPGTVGYPGGPDIEKIEVDKVRKKQGRSAS